MKPERWNEVDKILQSVLERSPAERQAYVDEVCSGDEELRREVLTLIGSHEQAGRFMASPALEESGDVFEDGAKLKHGDSVGRYKITKPIGHGGMGEVYLAEHTTQNREVALKILPRHFLDDPQRVQRFRQEARAVLALNHPNVVTVYDLGEAAGVHYIATEFVEGQTLRERLARERLTITEAVDIGLQVAGALAYAHEKGVVHRDVKPENIMLRPDGYVKVLDFGIAKLTERLAATVTVDDLAEAQMRMQVDTSPGMVMGTPHYMSPEQARGKKVDERADTWSLGVVLYEMLTGRQPFAGETPSDVISVILQRDPVMLSTLLANAPAELERIISKALDKSKDERYQTAKDFLADLRRFKHRYEHESETEAENVVLQERTRTHILIEDDQDESISAQKIIEAESLPMRQELAAAQTPRTNRKWPLVALIVLLGLTGIVFVVRTLRGSSATPSKLPSQPKTLAVLPFKALVANERDESLEMGMADTLITRLGNLHEIVVRPTSAVRKYTDLQQDAAAAGRELSVDAVLDGNIQKAGDQLRVTARLVRVSDGATIWTDKFDTEFKDIFAVQDSISERVAGVLAVKLSGEEKQGLSKRYTESVEAYQLYLKGYHHWSTFGQTELQTSINYYNEALKKDPNYALAYSGIANTYSVIGIYGPLPAGEAMPRAREAAQRALALDESLAEAHVALGAVKIFYDSDWPGAERELKRALDLDPNNTDAHNLYGYYLQAMGKGDHAVVEMKRAKELAPEWRIPNNDYLLALFSARRYDEAIEQSRQVVKLDPNNYFPYCILGQALTQQGRYEEAAAELRRSVSLPGQQPSVRALTELGYFYAVTGEKGEALKIIEQLKEKAKPSTPFQIAEVYAGLGDNDQAFAWLGRSNDERFAFTWKVVITPQFDSLRSDPRYVALLRRMNLSP